MNGSLSGPRALVIAGLLLAVGAAGPPVDAQQALKIAKIGWLSVSTPAAAANVVEAFRQGLRELGHVEGKTFFGTGFVATLARPGGNVTGLSNISAELSGKR